MEYNWPGRYLCYPGYIQRYQRSTRGSKLTWWGGKLEGYLQRIPSICSGTGRSLRQTASYHDVDNESLSRTPVRPPGHTHAPHSPSGQRLSFENDYTLRGGCLDQYPLSVCAFSRPSLVLKIRFRRLARVTSGKINEHNSLAVC